ncbi:MULTISPECIES: nicotinamide-nucleotide adenylyltransferase [Methanocorpusculum]|uniref:Nicotinamide-nucleotide adenylyltransferase n=1 Tax=Methanocorpusculum parvum TaxID=2193 RepID=A0AAX0Q8T8_9EURY|nr:MULTISPECIES: nicotinamide-nucleotide adenylyltransferase [Methanocorpusculum]PAV09763.1 nicotinate-nucleotide adenylyltransferase [Methanocorpusculum parvum]
MIRGLYVGRFQPYHNGHKAFIQKIAEEVDELVIGIGSAQMSHTVRHPFTAGERILMIARDLTPLDIPIYIIPLEDVARNALWVSHVISMCPPVTQIYTSNQLISQLFLEAGRHVVCPSGLCPHKVLSSEMWCSLVQTGNDWKSYVPLETVRVIEDVGGVERIRSITQTDECSELTTMVPQTQTSFV